MNAETAIRELQMWQREYDLPDDTKIVVNDDEPFSDEITGEAMTLAVAISQLIDIAHPDIGSPEFPIKVFGEDVEYIALAHVGGKRIKFITTSGLVTEAP